MTLSDQALDQLFREARTHNGWQPKPVDDAVLEQLIELTLLGPTSANSSPGRFVFVKTAEGKEKLRPALSAGNLDKTMAAPSNHMIRASDINFGITGAIDVRRPRVTAMTRRMADRTSARPLAASPSGTSD